MKITIIAVGKLKEKYLSLGIKEYSKRLSKYFKLEIIEVSDEKAPEKLSKTDMEIIKGKEGDKILKRLSLDSFIITLCIEGKQFSSEEFSKQVDKILLQGYSHITFIIGGSLGLSKKVIDKSNLKLSFSKFTFPHQLMRLILLEQIYRGFRIRMGEPYHK